MIPVATFSGKRVALFGLGGSGIATAGALMAGGAEVVAFDDNPNSVERAADEGIATGNLREIEWRKFEALILAPGVPLTHPQPHWTVDLAIRAGIEIIGDIELFSRELVAAGRRAPFIAITGTNGKSTTTALVAHVLNSAGRDVQMGGNIGRSVLDLDPVEEGEAAANQVYVIECSSYQIDLAPTLAPHVGVLLNLTPDHLERHGTMENYSGIKERLAANSDLAVVGVDDPPCRIIAMRCLKADRLLVTISNSADDSAPDIRYDGTGLIDDKGARVINLDGIGSLRGRHNAQNAAAAFAACQAVGLSIEEIQSGLRSFPGLVHRMEQVGHVDKVLFVNDSKATNAEAAAPALSSFDKSFWIAGGLAKDGGISPLAPHFSRIAKAYFIGEAAGTFAAQLDDTIPYEISGTLQDAVNHAASDAQKAGGTQAVLLSPAAASFDQFPNFEKRGEAFKEAVARLDGFEKIKG